ncbi:MAG: NIL domain-containing protein [Cyanosarcina radialis HA8281-LM2]|jgi:hypothetical protein|nr:NIL domain-containing protein [Cyanosarcina radialis HA8281-LM2]
MTAILAISLLASYTVFGLSCSLILFGSLTPQTEVQNFSRKKLLLAGLALPIWLPFWLIREWFSNFYWDEDNEYLFDDREKLCREADLSPTTQASSSFTTLLADKLQTKEWVKTRIKIQIPHRYVREPVISCLTSDYGLTFNITEAILTDSNLKDGWFDLELYGTVEQIKFAFSYLRQRQVRIWCF